MTDFHQVNPPDVPFPLREASGQPSAGPDGNRLGALIQMLEWAVSAPSNPRSSSVQYAPHIPCLILSQRLCGSAVKLALFRPRAAENASQNGTRFGPRHFR